MSELTTANLFDTAYKATLDGIKDPHFSADETWRKLTADLRKAVGEKHFDDSHDPALSALRDLVAGAHAKPGKEGEVLAHGAAADSPVKEIAVKRAAALKLLRHPYL